MDEIWERAVETALEGVTDFASARTLTLDGAVKCVHGRLPPPSVLEKFQNLHHLSIANIGVSSLEQFPRLQNLQKLILSDNRIAGGLEHLVEAGLESLRDLDLSNNRIQFIEDLAPLAQLKLVSLDLYECPVTRVKDYRARVFGLIKSLKYLDKMDAEENERPESDDEEDDEEEDEEDDPGSGEIDGEGKPHGLNNGQASGGGDDIVDVDEEESDADEEETETSRGRENGFTIHQGNGFRVSRAGENEVGEEDDEEDGEDDDDEGNESVEEIDEDEGEDEDVVEVVEVHEVEDSSDDDGDDEDDTEDDDEDDDEDEVEGVDNEGDLAEPASTGRLTSTEGEIDGHEQGEDDGDDDDNVESGEEEQDVEGDFEEDDGDFGEGYLVQRVGQPVDVDGVGSDMEAVNEVDGEEEEEDVEDDDEEDDDDDLEEDDLGEVQVIPPPEPSSSHPKRKRDDNGDGSSADDEDDDESNRSSKKHH